MKLEVYLEPPRNFNSAVEAAGCFIEWEGKFLYLKRAPGRIQENTWCVPAGKLEAGEDPRAAVIRETSEEVGLDIDASDLQNIGSIYVRLPHLEYDFHIFRKRLAKKPAISLKLDEHTESRWITASEALKLPLIHGGIEALQFNLGQPMKIRKDPFTLLGIALRTDNTKAAAEIPQHWERFMKENILAQIPNKKSPNIYALYTDYVSDHTAPYTLLLGCEVAPDTKVPAGFAIKHIPAATYSRIPVSGPHPQGILNAWQTVWRSNIPRSFTSDFEVYGPDFQTKQSLELFIALKECKSCSCH